MISRRSFSPDTRPTSCSWTLRRMGLADAPSPGETYELFQWPLAVAILSSSWRRPASGGGWGPVWTRASGARPVPGK
jgi:hypothetical protein